MKLMLAKSIFLGKLGLVLWFFTFLKNKTNSGGHLYSHNLSVKNHEGHNSAYHDEYGYDHHHSDYNQYKSNYEKYRDSYKNIYDANYQEYNSYDKNEISTEDRDSNSFYYSNYDFWNRQSNFTDQEKLNMTGA